MAVGDVVAGLGALSSVATFQPAAGVEVILTIAYAWAQYVAITDDGSEKALIYGNMSSGQSTPSKLAINNSYYVTIRTATGFHGTWTGIQIK